MLWLVKWPQRGDSTVSIVSAQDREDLFWMIDAEDDPEGCVVAPLVKPLHLKLKPKNTPVLKRDSPELLGECNAGERLQQDLSNPCMWLTTSIRHAIDSRT